MSTFNYDDLRFRDTKASPLSTYDWDALVDKIQSLESTLNRVHLSEPGSDSHGRLGIGTSTPAANLDIVSNPETGLMLASSQTGDAVLRLATQRSDLSNTFGAGTINQGNKGWLIQAINENSPKDGDTNRKGNFKIAYFNDQQWKQALSIQRETSYLGVGTDYPNGKLQIINKPQDGNGNTLILGPTNSANLRLGYHADYSWIQSHGSKPLSINPKGNNVGVGVVNPTEKLHVGGTVFAVNLRASSDLIVGKNARFYGTIKNKDNSWPIRFQRFGYSKFRYHHPTELKAGKLGGHASYKFGRYGSIMTNIAVDDYGAGVVGFDTGVVDINENGKGKFMAVRVIKLDVKRNGKTRKEWFVYPNLRTHQGTVAKFGVDVCFVSRQLASVSGY